MLNYKNKRNIKLLKENARNTPEQTNTKPKIKLKTPQMKKENENPTTKILCDLKKNEMFSVFFSESFCLMFFCLYCVFICCLLINICIFSLIVFFFVFLWLFTYIHIVIHTHTYSFLYAKIHYLFIYFLSFLVSVK